MVEEFLHNLLKNIVYQDVEGKKKKQFDEQATKRNLVLLLPKILRAWGKKGLMEVLEQILLLIKKSNFISYQQVKEKQEESFYRDIIIEDFFAFVHSLCFIYEFLYPYLPEEKKKEKIVIGVLAPAKLDRGKNLIKLFWLYEGYQVIDIGKELEFDQLVDAAIKYETDILAVSCMLGSTKENLSCLINLLAQQEKRIPLIIGGLTANAVLAYQLAEQHAWPVYYGQDVNSAGLVLQQALNGHVLEKPLFKNPSCFQDRLLIAKLAEQLGFELYKLELKDIAIDQYSRLGCLYCSGEKKRICPLETGEEKQKELEESKHFVQNFSFALLLTYPLFDDEKGELCKQVWLKYLSLEKELKQYYSKVWGFKFPFSYPLYCRPLHEQYNINMLPTLQGLFGENYGGKIYALVLLKY